MDGMTSLFFAIQKKHFDVIKELLEAGANANQVLKNKSKRSVLHFAVSSVDFIFAHHAIYI